MGNAISGRKQALIVHRCDSHTVITHKLCDTYHDRFKATPIYADACSPQRECPYFRFHVKQGR